MMISFTQTRGGSVAMKASVRPRSSGCSIFARTSAVGGTGRFSRIGVAASPGSAEAALGQVDAGAIHQDVDAPVALVDVGGGGSNLVLVAYVADADLGLRLLRRRLERCARAAGEHHFGPQLRKLDRGGEADTRATAGDPRHLTVERIAWHRRAPPLVLC